MIPCRDIHAFSFAVAAHGREGSIVQPGNARFDRSLLAIGCIQREQSLINIGLVEESAPDRGAKTQNDQDSGSDCPWCAELRPSPPILKRRFAWTFHCPVHRRGCNVFLQSLRKPKLLVSFGSA